ncbi:MAG TPA: hypothetical protein VFX70_05515 [Mycobacteriales bacterium]|nr:hypothetical protein [Mycobacteriales bacterium]
MPDRDDTWPAPATRGQERSERSPAGDLIEGGTRVRRGRAAVLTVLAGAVLVGVLLARPDPPVPPAPRPAPTVAPGPDFTANGIRFTDAEHGYVLVEPCRLPTTCRGTWTLLRTADSGRHWHRVGSPLDTRAAQYVQVYARGRRDVGLVIDGARFVSADAGATWRPMPPVRMAGPVRTVPAGDDIGYYCPVAVTPPGCADRLSAFDPVTGVTHPLVTQPPLIANPATRQMFAVTAAARVWVLATPLSGTPQLLRSADSGRHWRAVPTPAGQRWFNPELLLSPDGNRLYLVNRDINTSLVRNVWRLTDPATGRWVPAVVGGRREEIEDARVLPGGELRYADLAGNAWLTENLATRLVPAPRARMDGRLVNVNLDQVVDGALVATPVVGLRGDRILISTDGGQHWRVHPVHP